MARVILNTNSYNDKMFYCQRVRLTGDYLIAINESENTIFPLSNIVMYIDDGSDNYG